MDLHRIEAVAFGIFFLLFADLTFALPNASEHSSMSYEMMGPTWRTWLQGQKRHGYGIVECTYNSIVPDGVPWTILDIFEKGGQKSWFELQFPELSAADIQKSLADLTSTVKLDDDHMTESVRQVREVFGDKLGRLSDSDIRFRLYNTRRSVNQFTSGRVVSKGSMKLADLVQRGPLQELAKCFPDLTSEDLVKNKNKLFALIDSEHVIDSDLLHKIQSSGLELSHSISEESLLEGLEHAQKCVLNFNGYSMDGLIPQIHTILDADCKTWVAALFPEIPRSSIVPTKHRLVGHKPLEMKITMDDVVAFRESFFPDGYPPNLSDRIVMQRLDRLRRIVLSDMTIRAQKMLGLSRREARAFVQLFGVDNHIIADTLEGGNSPRYSAQVADCDIVRADMKRQIRVLVKDQPTARRLCNQIDEAYRGAQLVGGKKRQAVATAFSNNLKEVDFEPIRKPYADNVLRQSVPSYSKANAQIKLAGGRAGYLWSQAKRSTGRWGGVGVGDAVGTLAMLYFTGELNRREMVKHGVSIAIAGGLAVGTEVALAAAGLSVATMGSSGIISWAVNILAPVPIGGGAIIVAGGVYLGTRWAVCAAFDAYEQQQVERIEAEAVQYERRFRIQKLSDLSEGNTKMLRQLAIGEALGESRD